MSDSHRSTTDEPPSDRLGESPEPSVEADVEPRDSPQHCPTCARVTTTNVTPAGRRVCAVCKTFRTGRAGERTATAHATQIAKTLDQIERRWPSGDDPVARNLREELARVMTVRRQVRPGSAAYQRLNEAASSLMAAIRNEPSVTVERDDLTTLPIADLRARAKQIVEQLDRLPDEARVDIDRPASDDPTRDVLASMQQHAPATEPVAAPSVTCEFCRQPVERCTAISKYLGVRRSDTTVEQDRARGYDTSRDLNAWLEGHHRDPEWRAEQETKEMWASLRRQTPPRW